MSEVQTPDARKRTSFALRTFYQIKSNQTGGGLAVFLLAVGHSEERN